MNQTEDGTTMRMPALSLKAVALVAFAPIGLAFVLGFGWVALRSCDGSGSAGGGSLAGKPATSEVQLAGTTKIELAAPGNLIIELGEPELLRIDATPRALGQLTTEVEGDRLVIRARGRIHDKPKFHVTVKRLEGLTLAGSGDVIAPDLKGEEVTVAVAGSGDLVAGRLEAKRVMLRLAASGDAKLAGIRAGSLDVTSVGSGNLQIGDGEVEEQRIMLAGSGDYEARKLRSARAAATINGSGEVAVFARDSLKATINGSGKISYRGRPSIQQVIHGSGSVESIGD
jgi:hypothetical protein